MKSKDQWASDSLLYSDAYIRVLLSNDGLLVRVIRTAVPYPAREALLDSYGKVISSIDRPGRKGRSVMIDTRAPVGRNDPWFEEGMSWVRPRIAAGFVRVGVLIHSAIGALQIRRWVSEDGIERLTGTDEEALVAGLIKDLPPRPRQRFV